MRSLAKSRPGLRRAVRDILLYGFCGGLLITVLKLTEYRFLVLELGLDLWRPDRFDICRAGYLAGTDADPNPASECA